MASGKGILSVVWHIVVPNALQLSQDPVHEYCPIAS